MKAQLSEEFIHITVRTSLTMTELLFLKQDMKAHTKCHRNYKNKVGSSTVALVPTTGSVNDQLMMDCYIIISFLAFETKSVCEKDFDPGDKFVARESVFFHFNDFLYIQTISCPYKMCCQIIFLIHTYTYYLHYTIYSVIF